MNHVIKLIAISSIAISSIALTACNNKKDETVDTASEQGATEQLQTTNGDNALKPSELVADLHNQLADDTTNDSAIAADEVATNSNGDPLESVINESNSMVQPSFDQPSNNTVSGTSGAQTQTPQTNAVKPVKAEPTSVAVEPMDATASPAEKAAMAEALAMADSQ